MEYGRRGDQPGKAACEAGQWANSVLLNFDAARVIGMRLYNSIVEGCHSTSSFLNRRGNLVSLVKGSVGAVALRALNCVCWHKSRVLEIGINGAADYFRQDWHGAFLQVKKAQVTVGLQGVFSGWRFCRVDCSSDTAGCKQNLQKQFTYAPDMIS